jgi:Na+/serine symporter
VGWSALGADLCTRYLLIFSTSSSESALPRLIAKMEHLGVDRSTVGVVVPTGYSFNLDGTAIYLTMASLSSPTPWVPRCRSVSSSACWCS